MHRQPARPGRRPAFVRGVLALALSALIVPGGAHAQSPAMAGPEGTSWVVTRVVVDGTLTTMPLDAPVATMQLWHGIAVGNGGCNAWSGGYALDGAAITFGPITSTQRQCLVAAPAEGPLFEALPMVAAWSIGDGALTLASGDASPLVVLATDVGPSTGVRGVWRIAGLTAADGTPVDAALLDEASASFGGGRFRATVGCNWLTGDYAQDGADLTVAVVSRTKVYCEGLMEAEDALALALEDIARVDLGDGTLVLTDRDGDGRVWLVPARDQSPQLTPSPAP